MLSSSLCVLLVASVGACTDQSSETGPGQDVLEGKLSNNGLVLDQQALDLLSTQALSTTDGADLVVDETEFGALLQANGGADLLSYLVTCALGEDQELKVASSGQTLTGNLGLAPQWAVEPCDESCQRWVSACVLAHSNAFGNEVTISPRGGNSGMAWNSGIEAEFDYQEAAYFGNVFAAGEERVMQACAGAGLVAVSLDTGSIQDGAEFLAGRICGVGACSFEFAGLCRDSLVEGVPGSIDTGVCATYANGYFSDCEESEGFEGELPLGNPNDTSSATGDRYSEVITVYLSK